jgi:hypothetical protein
MMTEIAVLMVLMVNSGYFSVDGRDNNGYNCSVVMVIMVMMVIIALL